MTISAATSKETSYTTELYPSIAAVAATYGDPEGKYAAFLAKGVPGYATEAYFLWNQPLAGGEKESALSAASSTSGPNNSTSNKKGAKENGAIANAGNWLIGAAVVITFQYFFNL